jgi:hypothetical protein
MNGIYSIEKNKLKHIKPLPHHIQQKELCYAAKDPELIEDVNKALLVLSKSGQLSLIQDKWFGSGDEIERDNYLRTLGGRYQTPISIACLLCFLFMFFFGFRTRHLKKALDRELVNKQNLEKELNREYSISCASPVILYK